MIINFVLPHLQLIKALFDPPESPNYFNVIRFHSILSYLFESTITVMDGDPNFAAKFTMHLILIILLQSSL